MKHVKDIAERYLLPGETQDVALMFVPSEAIYSDLVEHFDDVVQKAHRARVVIVSPTLMMMAISVAQAICATPGFGTRRTRSRPRSASS